MDCRFLQNILAFGSMFNSFEPLMTMIYIDLIKRLCVIQVLRGKGPVSYSIQILLFCFLPSLLPHSQTVPYLFWTSVSTNSPLKNPLGASPLAVLWPSRYL